MEEGMTAALLVLDVTGHCVERVGDGADLLLRSVGQAASAARTAGIPVIYVRVSFREGAPEVSPRNSQFTRIAGLEPGRLDEDAPATQVHESVAPHRGDIIVIKRRVSAFSGSDLDVVLRAKDVNELVLTGTMTGGAVLSTFLQAVDLDFRLTVLEDGCADYDEERHSVCMRRIFPRDGQGYVMGTEQWASRLPEASPPS
jgi:nicotinamidase-related amidase